MLNDQLGDESDSQSVSVHKNPDQSVTDKIGVDIFKKMLGDMFVNEHTVDKLGSGTQIYDDYFKSWNDAYIDDHKVARAYDLSMRYQSSVDDPEGFDMKPFVIKGVGKKILAHSKSGMVHNLRDGLRTPMRLASTAGKAGYYVANSLVSSVARKEKPKTPGETRRLYQNFNINGNKSHLMPINSGKHQGRHYHGYLFQDKTRKNDKICITAAPALQMHQAAAEGQSNEFRMKAAIWQMRSELRSEGKEPAVERKIKEIFHRDCASYVQSVLTGKASARDCHPAVMMYVEAYLADLISQNTKLKIDADVVASFVKSERLQEDMDFTMHMWSNDRMNDRDFRRNYLGVMAQKYFSVKPPQMPPEQEIKQWKTLVQDMHRHVLQRKGWPSDNKNITRKLLDLFYRYMRQSSPYSVVDVDIVSVMQNCFAELGERPDNVRKLTQKLERHVEEVVDKTMKQQSADQDLAAGDELHELGNMSHFFYDMVCDQKGKMSEHKGIVHMDFYDSNATLMLTNRSMISFKDDRNGKLVVLRPVIKASDRKTLLLGRDGAVIHSPCTEYYGDPVKGGKTNIYAVARDYVLEIYDADSLHREPERTIPIVYTGVYGYHDYQRQDYDKGQLDPVRQAERNAVTKVKGEDLETPLVYSTNCKGGINRSASSAARYATANYIEDKLYHAFASHPEVAAMTAGDEMQTLRLFEQIMTNKMLAGKMVVAFMSYIGGESNSTQYTQAANNVDCFVKNIKEYTNNRAMGLQSKLQKTKHVKHSVQQEQLSLSMENAKNKHSWCAKIKQERSNDKHLSGDVVRKKTTSKAKRSVDNDKHHFAETILMQKKKNTSHDIA